MVDYFFANILGKWGVVGSIGLLIFWVTSKKSEEIFNWIEQQTFGTRDYLVEKAEVLFIKLDPQKVTIGLIVISFGVGAISFSLFALFGYYTLGFFVGLVLGFVGWKLPRPFMDYLVNRRNRKYQHQMVDALNLLANGLRAGLSFPQSLGMVVDEMGDPVAQEFNLVLQQNRLGIPLEECLENLYNRVPLEDNQMFVTSINILRETGGNLSEVFETIVNVIRERVRLKQKLETYVAQGKTQGIVMFCVPFVLFALFSATDPEAIGNITSSIIGIALLIGAFALTLLGGFFMYKIVDIKL